MIQGQIEVEGEGSRVYLNEHVDDRYINYDCKMIFNFKELDHSSNICVLEFGVAIDLQRSTAIFN